MVFSKWRQSRSVSPQCSYLVVYLQGANNPQLTHTQATCGSNLTHKNALFDLLFYGLAYGSMGTCLLSKQEDLSSDPGIRVYL